MKTLGVLIILSLFNFTAGTGVNSIYDFEPTNIDGKETPLSKYKGKVLLIVNTASECGYTPQYEGLQNLFEEYKDKGLVVLGFPANNFGGQAPGTDEEIKKFCTVNYSVTFPMFSKISVKGKNQHPLFTYLTSASNPDFTGVIKWNFEKFLINQEGVLIHRFRSAVEPESETIVKAIEVALNS
ncbi:MAG TPA: glutathione peroxidase [Balneolaceae bacterium]|nr:glutathione peroxidase [Balneolaceae bacterium]